MQSHIEKLTHLFNDLQREAGDEFHKIFKKVEYPKGTFLLKEGAVCQNTWLIKSGIARVFSVKKDVEITTYFAFPGEFVDSYRSFLLQKPSKENIQLIENSVLSAISRKDIKALAVKYPVVNEIDKLITELYAIWLEDRIYSIQFSTAKGKYDELMKKQPLYIQRIPLTYLASYLGTTIETLSRIRGKKN
jgi:CRP-like cAMP-binding protein